MNHTDTPAPVWPRWALDLFRALPVRSQYVLTANIRDVYLTPTADGQVLLPLMDCLWEALSSRGYEFLVTYDKVDGLGYYPVRPEIETAAAQLLEVSFKDGRQARCGR
jgi:hypothetical protein